jgi:hypothetical protein
VATGYPASGRATRPAGGPPPGRLEVLRAWPERSNLAALTDSPYLVEVDPAALSWLKTALWPNDDWGLFLVLPERQGSSRPDEAFRALHRHLLTFLQVLSPTGDLWLFRGHGPRLVPAFLGARA